MTNSVLATQILQQTLVLVLVFVAGLAVTTGLPTPQLSASTLPTRVLAVSSNPPVNSPSVPPDYAGAIDLTVQAGARGSFLSWTWKALEPSPRVFKLDEVKEGLRYLGNTRGLDVLVGLQVINTTAKEVPSDLSATPFDADVMTTRFHAQTESRRDRMAPLLRSY